MKSIDSAPHIPEIAPGDARLDAFLRAGEPCVVRGLAGAWPARLRWTPAWFAEAHPTLVVSAARLNHRELATEQARGVPLRSVAMKEFVRSVLDHRATDYVMAPLGSLPRSVRDNLEVPAVCRGAPWASSKFWFSPELAVSPLHFDLPHNVHVQLHGRKRFLLFSRRESPRLYPRPPWSSLPNFSRVDPERPDLDAHPRFSEAKPGLAELSPGDAVFLPSRTWHHVKSETTSISVNFWWARGALAALAWAGDTWKRVRRLDR